MRRSIQCDAKSSTICPAGFFDAGSAAHTGLATHIAFEVEDLQAAKTQLDQLGVPIAGGPMARGDGVMQLYFYDPDGYLLELFQWVPGSEIGAAARNVVTQG